MASVSMSMRVEERPHADQGEVWSRISEKASKMKSHSRTSAMSDIFEDNKEKVEEYVAAFTPVENQAGMLVMVGDDIIGLDLFDSADTLKKLMPKLVRSFALDALEVNSEKAYHPNKEDAEKLLKNINDANTTLHDGVGEGESYRLQSKDVVGGALVFEDQVIHLTVFRNDAGQGIRQKHHRDSRVRRASQRRSRQNSSAQIADEDYLDIPEFLRRGRTGNKNEKD